MQQIETERSIVPAELDRLDEMRWNQEWYVQEYFDVNGKALCPKLAEKAMLEELDYMMGIQV